MTAVAVSELHGGIHTLDARHLTRHLDWCEQRNLRETYIQTRRRTIAQLERELGIAADVATERDLIRWYEQVSARMVPEARGVYLSHVQCYYRWLLAEQIILADPTARLIRPRLKRRLPRPMNSDELARAIQTAPARVRPWLLLAAFEGLRTIEIAHLRTDDVDLDANVICVNGKGGRQRLLPLHPEVREALLPLLHKRGWLFHHYSRPGPPTAHNVSFGINHHLRRQGITSTAHAARHWFLTNIYRTSLDLRLTQELAGHSSPTTTAGYAAWSPGRAAGIVNELRLVSPVPGVASERGPNTGDDGCVGK